MLSNKLILAYGLEDKELETFNMSKLPYRRITTETADLKIKDIIAGVEGRPSDKKIPNEKVILFNDFSDEELEKVIKIIRATMGKAPILAVVTETSAQWSFNYLLEHLMEEREWYKKMQQEKGRN